MNRVVDVFRIDVLNVTMYTRYDLIIVWRKCHAPHPVVINKCLWRLVQVSPIPEAHTSVFTGSRHKITRVTKLDLLYMRGVTYKSFAWNPSGNNSYLSV